MAYAALKDSPISLCRYTYFSPIAGFAIFPAPCHFYHFTVFTNFTILSRLLVTAFYHSYRHPRLFWHFTFLARVGFTFLPFLPIFQFSALIGFTTFTIRINFRPFLF